MKKLLLGLVATAAIAAPLAGTANAASVPAPTKATGTVTWVYGDVTGSVVFTANDKTGGTIDYTDSNGQVIHGVVAPGSVDKDGNTVTFEGTVTDSNWDFNIGDPFTGVVKDFSTSGSHGDQIGLFVDRDVDGILANVTGGNLTAF